MSKLMKLVVGCKNSKEFVDKVQTHRLLYLHGLASSKKANTARLLKEYLEDFDVLSIDIPPHPLEAISYISKIVKEYKPHVIVGTSLGGFYASLFDGPFKILINPALKPDLEIKNILGGYGTYPYLKQREDGSKSFEFTNHDEKEFKTLRSKFLAEINDDIKKETYAFFGIKDEVVNDKYYFIEIFNKEHAYDIDANHRLADRNIVEDIIPFIMKLI